MLIAVNRNKTYYIEQSSIGIISITYDAKHALNIICNVCKVFKYSNYGSLIVSIKIKLNYAFGGMHRIAFIDC